MSWACKNFYVASPFKTVWRSSDVTLNDKEPSVEELDHVLLLKLRSFASRVRPFPGDVLLTLDLSIRWPNLKKELSLIYNGKAMSTLDFIKLEDTLDVEFIKVVVEWDGDVVVRNWHVRYKVGE
ncbi:hypothetical protein L1987_65025 [Smallanthus sonchifolius]|uniref:Uncharacterized protein n=1 Tax=Smallanthus sonchifolius TaxID=185202 RepID=A0ACB9BTJ1_9ASTR|nr:hypothetical protein L1987_65025 [Smallanthus sonchifolius]